MKKLLMLILLVNHMPQANAYTQLTSLCHDFSKVGVTENFINKCKTSLQTVLFSMDYEPICKELQSQKKNQEACLRTLIKKLGPESFSSHFNNANVIQPFAPTSTLGKLTIKCIFESTTECFQMKLQVTEDIVSLKKVSDFVETPINLDVPLVVKKDIDYSAPAPEINKECECIKREAKKLHPVFNIDGHLKAVDTKVNNTLYLQVSRNFMNNFSLHTEDSLFFYPNDMDQKLRSCNFSELQVKVDSKCSSNGVDDDTKSRRIKSILSSFGNNIQGNSLPEMFKNLEDEILNKNGNIHRKVYDSVRRKSVHEPEYLLFQQLFLQTSKNPRLKQELDQLISDGRNPLEAYENLFVSGSEDLFKVYEAMAQTDKITPIMQNFRDVLKTKNNQKIGEFWGKHLRRIINVQPVARQIFSDAEIFKKFMSESRDKDILAFARKSGPDIRKNLRKDCQDLITQFSDLVCVQGNDYKSLASKDDIMQVVTDTVAPPELKEALLCDHTQKEGPSPFDNLRSGLNEFLQSDYQDRNLNTPDKVTNGFSIFASTVNDPKKIKAKDYASRAIEADPEVKFSKVEAARLNNIIKISNNKIDTNSKEVSAVVSSSDTSLKPVFSKKSEIFEAKEEVVSTPVIHTPVPAQVAAPVPVYASTPVIASVKPESETSWRDDFKEFLSKKEDKEEIERLMSNTKESDLAELKKLQDDLAKSNQDVLLAMQRIEQEKLDQLQRELKKYDDLKTSKRTVSQKRTEPEYGDHSPDASDVYQVKTPASPSQVHLSRESNRSPERSIASVQPSVNSVEPKAAESLTKPIAVASSQAGESLLVVSGGVRAEEPKDVSSEFIRFINEKNPDAETLKKIKDSKLLYQYRLAKDGVEIEKEMVFEFPVLNDDAKKLLEAKLQEKNKEEEIRRSYSISALKLILINQISSPES